MYMSVDFLNDAEKKESSQMYRVGFLSANFAQVQCTKVQGGIDRTTTDLVTQLICSFHYSLYMLYGLALVHT